MKNKFNLKDINKVAERILEDVNKRNFKNAKVVTLSGDLGAGKTTLTQEIAKALGIKEKVISPTFVIMKKYKTTHDSFKQLVHIDAYRLEKSQELMSLGWSDLLKDEGNLIILEWPEKVLECLNNDIYKVILNHEDEENRSIETLL